MARIFVAIPLSDDLQEQAALIRDKLAHLPVRWLTGKNLHVTLVPPWEENDAFTAIKLLGNLSGAVKPFSIVFEGITLGPGSRQPRLIWASGSAPNELINLKSAVEKTFDKKPEPRPYKLHVTLARFRYENFDENIFKDVSRPIDWQEEVKSIILMQSHLSPAGADYEILAKVDL